MLSFSDFFATCSGLWRTDRTYHFVLDHSVERSYTEFRVVPIETADKQRILGQCGAALAATEVEQRSDRCPGFAIAFETRSETGEEVSMSLKALFVPEVEAAQWGIATEPLPLPTAAQVQEDGEVICGLYLRDEGYSEAGAIAGRFTYQPTRQTLEMTTYYNRSVAVDQMRFVSPNLRMRTIVTYQRPTPGEVPTVINLMGFGVERRSELHEA